MKPLTDAQVSTLRVIQQREAAARNTFTLDEIAHRVFPTMPAGVRKRLMGACLKNLADERLIDAERKGPHNALMTLALSDAGRAELRAQASARTPGPRGRERIYHLWQESQ